MIETRGLIAALEAADAMLKAANVELVGRERTDPAMITITITGEVGAVRAAVDAGRAAAERVGGGRGVVLSAHVIPRMGDGLFDKLIGPNAERPKVSRQVAAVRPSDPPATGSADGPPASDDELEAMSVRELRALARQQGGLDLSGRDISKADRETLLAQLRSGSTE